ncbi:phosphatase PAP2 family protein [Piscinibacter sp. HJYY11]|uniref:phosphatase PAP2 family protein n=1 Tax=Piscinibacter sp. HJYY11 TaxID=2801333 RepID=UPI00191CC013|nr:phosphatase PAP2 family protein [Piscinibacter sp. HJYY11]MBL0728425.1 phosphatase PAP2 family protein [Piscinibacter sp. HJYY11]
MSTALPSASASTPATRWSAELWARVRLHFVLKTLGITAFIWVFFIGYFWVLRHPVFPVTLMPLTVIDQWVPFQPAMLVPYLTLWFYVGVPAGLAASFRHLIVHGLWATALCVTGLAIFYFWPTAVPPRPFDASAYPGFALLQGVDAPGNACPSMHVAVAVFAALHLRSLLRGIGAPAWLRWLNGLWCLAIVYSTLATKQHVALDAVAGVLLGTTFALFSLRWRPGGWWADAGGPGTADIIRRQ